MSVMYGLYDYGMCKNHLPSIVHASFCLLVFVYSHVNFTFSLIQVKPTFSATPSHMPIII